MSTQAKVGVGLVGAGALIWFFVSWQVLGSPLIDAIGETVGSLAAVMLIVSVIGTARAGEQEAVRPPTPGPRP